MTPPVPGDKSIFVEAHNDGWHRLFCDVTRDDCDTETALANAKLIAAAPDLLAALQVFIEATEDLGPGVDVVRIDAMADDIKQARAAIAKALHG